MSDISKVMKMIKDKEVKFVDLRFTDTKGKWQHTPQTEETIDERITIGCAVLENPSKKSFISSCIIECLLMRST